MDLSRLPKPKPPTIVRKRMPNVQPNWGVHPLEQQKRSPVARANEPSLVAGLPKIAPRGATSEKRTEPVEKASSPQEKPASLPAAKIPPPPPRRSSLEATDAASLVTSPNAEKRPSPPAQDPPRKPPPPPRRTSMETVTEPAAASLEKKGSVGRIAVPPIPKRPSMEIASEDITKASANEPRKPPSIPRRASSEVTQTAPATSVPESASAVRTESLPMKKTSEDSTASTESRPKSAGGLAARQAMLANVLGGGGSRSVPPSPVDSPNTPTAGGAGGPPRSQSLPPREEIKKPKNLADDAELSTAASELQKKLLGGGGSSSKKDLSKYEKMQKAGLPQGAIEHAMRKDGVDPKLLFG